ncbi:MAG: hypothetical protein JJ902_19170 [Roseibium sp.]|nr:hypothetical protein [Roseibium sp.]
MSADTAKTINRLTTSYNETEDRLRVSGQLSGSETIVLWLTQRLARRLVQALCGWLDKDVAGTAADSVRQEFAQMAAEAGLAPQEPVKPREETAERLVTEVNLQRAGGQVTFVFRDAGGDGVNMSFSETELRQWLSIVRGSFERANWPLDCWPDWLLADPAPKEDGGRAFIH